MDWINTSRAYPATKSALERFVKQLIGWLAALFIFLQLVDGAVPQIRMALNGGYLGRDIFKPRIFALIPMTCAFLCFGLRIVPMSLLKAWFSFVLYLSALIFIQLVCDEKDPAVNMRDLADAYSYVLILPLTFGLCGLINEVALRRLLIFAMVPLSILGITQYVTSDAIVRPASLDGMFFINSWMFGGKVRGFSLFTSGLWFGYFLAFTTPLILILALRATSALKRCILLGILAVGLAAVFTTLTRNAYLLTTEALIAVWLIHVKFRYVRLLPFAFLAISIVFTLVAGGFSIIAAGDRSVLSADSVATRFSLWGQYLSLWMYSDVPMALFGTGISQLSRQTDSLVTIDNVLIATGVQIGLIGLFLFFWILWQLWILIESQIRKRHDDASPTQVAGVAFWSTFLASGVLNYSSPAYLVYGLFLFLLIRPAPLAGPEWQPRAVKAA